MRMLPIAIIPLQSLVTLTVSHSLTTTSILSVASLKKSLLQFTLQSKTLVILGGSPWLQRLAGRFRLPLESIKMQSLKEEPTSTITQGF